MRYHTQLTIGLTYQISGLKKAGFNQRRIAAELNIDKSTVSREVSRNTVKEKEKGHPFKRPFVRRYGRKRGSSIKRLSERLDSFNSAYQRAISGGAGRCLLNDCQVRFWLLFATRTGKHLEKIKKTLSLSQERFPFDFPQPVKTLDMCPLVC